MLSNHQQHQEIFARYLRILGINRKAPSLEALSELLSAHLMRIPFENISKLYYRNRENLRSLPGLEKYLDGIEHYSLGGTCYTNNYYFYLLLGHLGYEVILCGADMIEPDVHIVNIVSVEGDEYLVDVGYAAPFHEPLPRDLKGDYVIELGRDRYVLMPKDKNGCSRLEHYRDGQMKHGYLAKPIPRQIGYFDRVIKESYRDNATFMNALLLVRFYRSRSVAIHNLALVESEGSKTVIKELPNRNELSRVVEEYFSIPQSIVTEVLSELGEFKSIWD